MQIDQDTKTILVINVTRIGDTLLTTPALRAIARTWPHASIDVLGHRNRVEVLCALPFLRRVDYISKRSAPWRGWIDFFTKPYDLALVYGFDTALIRYAVRVAQHCVAYRQDDEALNRSIGTIVERPDFQSDHAVRLTFALPAALGARFDGGRLSYMVTQAERGWAAIRLANDLPANTKPIIGLQVASFPTKAYRDWPIDSFVELTQRILAYWPHAHFLILGGNEEKSRTEILKTHLGSAATLYAGTVSLRQTGALMSLLDLYIGVDTGPTHMMSSFDIPLVGLYHGFSRSELIGPIDHPCFYAVDHPLAGPDCSTEASMADISVDMVFDKVCLALSTNTNDK
jgi:heptosyltransferase-3